MIGLWPVIFPDSVSELVDVAADVIIPAHPLCCEVKSSDSTKCANVYHFVLLLQKFTNSNMSAAKQTPIQNSTSVDSIGSLMKIMGKACQRKTSPTITNGMNRKTAFMSHAFWSFLCSWWIPSM